MWVQSSKTSNSFLDYGREPSLKVPYIEKLSTDNATWHKE